MTADPHQATDQAALATALEAVHAALTGAPITPDAGLMPSAALERIVEAFGLTRFERAVLLLCAGMELDSRFAAACTQANGDPARGYPSFALAFTTLPDAHWSAMSRGRPLRRWQLIEMMPGETLAASRLRITERVLLALLGVESDGVLGDGVLRRIEPPPCDAAEPELLAAGLTALGRAGQRLLLTGGNAARRRTIAIGVLAEAGFAPWLLRAADLPLNATECIQLRLLWKRETLLEPVALCVELTDIDTPENLRNGARFLEDTDGTVIAVAPEDITLPDAGLLCLDLPPLDGARRRAAWQQGLGAMVSQAGPALDAAIAHFPPNPDSLVQIAGTIATMPDADPDTLRRTIWQICREQARRPMMQLAHRIEPRARWDDLVLPDLLIDTLSQIEAHLRHRSLVHEDWGFAGAAARGLGITAMFAGASGTGKTMAAEVLASRLELDLFQIDLSATVSKYIGETEKNLRRVFDAAEEGGAILLFDEADALFGKRTEVKDSHDRYANLEVSYLLQRMEAYRGVAILTTNMRQALDQAFMRRIRFVLDFPFPDATLRVRMWRRAFPANAPTEGLDFERLAMLSVTGGMIRNISTHAAFRAADEGNPVRMAHVLWAARLEYAKMDKPMTGAELRAIA